MTPTPNTNEEKCTCEFLTAIPASNRPSCRVHGFPSPQPESPTPEAPSEAGRAKTHRVHDLKTWPEYFEAVSSGIKTFEIRKNDRDYRIGDWLALHEYDPSTNNVTGRSFWAEVVYMTEWAQQGDHVVMGIVPLRTPVATEGAQNVVGSGETPETDAFHQKLIDGPLHAIAPQYRDFARILERQRNEARAERDAARKEVRDTSRIVQEWATKFLNQSNELNAALAEVRRKDEALGKLHAEFGTLVGYAQTVRLDRLDDTREFALQTVDWCEGLIEYSSRARAALSAMPQGVRG